MKSLRKLALPLVSMAVCLSGVRAAPAQAPVMTQPVPSAIYTDPAVDAAHPAHSQVLHIPTHGVLINGLLYAPPGAGTHPTLVICHGLPGNEKNLDLAQAVRRAGWNAVTFNYRGSWGSPGLFRFGQNPEDADAVLAYLRDPANAARLGIDPKRIVLAGHSMGGWVAAHTASHDHALMGVILISMADMSLVASENRADARAEMADDMETLAGVTADSMVDDMISVSKNYVMTNAAPGLAQLPLLALTSNDHLGPHTDSLVAAIKAKGGKKVTAMHLDTDHSYSDHRIALESIVIPWLAGLH
jgi:pimeloyl-ACP methyl ester carboxylesterase